MPSNFNSTTPAPPSGGVNVIFQTDGNGNDSAYLPGSVLGLPGGLNGDIQYNNNGVFGGSDATISAAGSIQIPEGQIVEWTSAGGYGYSDYTNAAISQLASNTLAFGDGVPGDVSGAAAMTALILFGSSSYGSYDLFHTTIYSGAEQNWSLILPPNPGTNGQVLTTNGTGVSYWSTIASSGGSVTSFSSGNLSPLFTTAVATPTTTPALSFTLNTQSANLVFAGPTSGVAATPTFRSLVAADLPAGTGTVTSVGLATGSGASDALYTISGSPVTTSGTLVETLNTQAKNTFLGGPISGANATPTFRGLNSADIPVPGSTGDILYNNGGVLGASLSTITAAGSITLPDTQVIQWTGSAYSSVGLSQLAADTLAVGNGNESDVSGAMAMTALILYGSSYYSAYDAFQTTILSGATTDWALVLPETSGNAGQVLVNIGSGFTSWESLTTLGVPWSALTNPTANLSLTMGTDTTTFNYATGLAAAWTWQNNTPTVTGASTTVALSTSTAPTHSGGISWTYTLAATESGAGSNGWVNALVTISGFTGGATGNNGASLLVTASTTTTVTIQNATGTTINTGTPVMISSAVSSSPVLQIAGTVNTGTAGTLNSAADVWSIQNVIGSVAPNPISTLTFTHTGSSGIATVSVPAGTLGTSGAFGLGFNSATVGLGATGNILAIMGTGGPTVRFYNGASQIAYSGYNDATSVQWGGVTSGIKTCIGSRGNNNWTTTGPITVIGNSGANINPTVAGTVTACLIGDGNTGYGGVQFTPSSGPTNLVVLGLNPIVNQTVSATGSYTGILVNVIETSLKGTSNKLLDLQAGTTGGTSKFTVSNGGVATVYGGNTTTKQGLAPILFTSIKTAQAAALSASSLVASTPAIGMWRISFVATITTAATSAAVLGGATGFTITYTNGNGDTVSKTTALSTPLGVGATNSTGDSASGDLYCYAGAATSITFSYGYTAGTGTAMQYDIAVYAEYLG